MISRIITAISISIFILVSSVKLQAQTTVTLYPIADTFLKYDSPDSNKGSSTVLKMSDASRSRIFVRFDQTAIASALAGKTLSSATLQLYITQNYGGWGAGKPVDVKRITTDWTESGTTWDCPIDTNTSNNSPNCTTQWNGGD